MGISYHPGLGEALWCDYTGTAPEMVKSRLAVVIVPKACQRSRLTTVIPLSTTPPEVLRPWHVKLSRDPLPDGKGKEVWAKCDMISVVSFDRLRGYYRRRGGARDYHKLRVSLSDIQEIRQAVLRSLGHPW